MHTRTVFGKWKAAAELNNAVSSGSLNNYNETESNCLYSTPISSTSATPLPQSAAPSGFRKGNFSRRLSSTVTENMVQKV
jgi:hypothetical protein